jgi:pyruvate dehydrogenase E2 component (dihydrolipoamide acetyltransferase)
MGEEYRLGMRIPVSRMRKLIAKVTLDSKSRNPHYYVSMDVDMASARRLKDATKNSETSLTYTDMTVRAVADALTEFPLLNGYVADEEIVIGEHASIGVMIDTPDGVIAPVIAAAETLTLTEIHDKLRELAEKARGRKLRPSEIRGATFSISNLGMFGVSQFAAIIGPGQCGVLALGGVIERVVVIDGQPAVRPIMTATLSVDHKIVDGAYAARFLQAFASKMADMSEPV